MDKLKTLTKQRATIKSALSRFEKYVNDIKFDELNENVVKELQLRLTKSEPLLDQFNQVNSEIKLHTDNTQSADEAEEIFENSYFALVTKVSIGISKFQSHVSATNQTEPQPLTDSNIRLPVINLPTYDGSLESWHEFYDAFSAMVDTNKQISDIQKFYYLKSSLKDGAAEVIKSLQISAQNYHTAWELLRDRYDNKRLIVHSYIDSLLNLPTSDKESPNTLRQLYDGIVKTTRALKTLDQSVQTWDTILIHLMTKKLDHTSRREWEATKYKTVFPLLSDFLLFLKTKCELLETLKANNSKINTMHQSTKREVMPQHKLKTYTVTSQSCALCKSSHQIFSCDNFLKLNTSSRINQIKRLRLCLNCLHAGHMSNECKSSLCKKCGKRHNTLLHLERHTEDQTNTTNSNNNVSSNDTASTSHSLVSNIKNYQVLLPTASIIVTDTRGVQHICRVLLDSGSQSNFITKALCNKLGLKSRKINTVISGINQSVSKLDTEVTLSIKSRVSNYSTSVSCLVLQRITQNLPSCTFNLQNSPLQIPANITLADPHFYKSKPVDMLLGSNNFWDLMCVGQIKLKKQGPTLQKTRLGWIVAGPLNVTTEIQTTQITSYCSTLSPNTDLMNQISKFWELESLSSHKTFTKEEKACEKHFCSTHKRDLNGRFVVSIPFNNNLHKLGNSKDIALKRFLSLENRLEKHSHLKEEYCKFMQEYIKLNHMSEINENQTNSKFSYFLPHHAVIKPSSTTTKLRVVFDGSCKSDSNLSLNDVQMVGPTLQNDIFSILIRFRKHAVVLTADIEKMYRQVLVRDDERRFQRIFWRDNPHQEISCFELNTVTYGTASAPFLAVRCLQQLADEYQFSHPLASNAIKNDFYVDDLLTGAQTPSELIELKNDISTILRSAKFELRKWLSNCNLRSPETDSNQLQALDLSKFLDGNQEAKTLGTRWDPISDIFKYTISMETECRAITKRTVLSTIAKIFDPLGLLTPVTIKGKMIMQALWAAQCSWDEALPAELHTTWLQFISKFNILAEINIPRHVLLKTFTNIELHGFSDASEKAYGACIYIRSTNQANQVTSRLLCSKSRVAPLKVISLPRLELCGALLLAQLAQRVRDSFNVKFNSETYWCDSTIVLNWIYGPPDKWKTFVANRVSEIQEFTRINNWRHIRSVQNPADLITRGILPHELMHCCHWWNGPSWLCTTDSKLLSENFLPPSINDIPECKEKLVTHVAVIHDLNIFTRFSSLSTLKRVTAWCLRFIHNASHLKGEEKRVGSLTRYELHLALTRLVKISQEQCYSKEIKCLSTAHVVKDKLLQLTPFLDKEGIIRVGGRLKYSHYSFDKKHPMLLHHQHPLTTLVMRTEHCRLLHCGARTLLASIRENFWPVSGMNLAKKTVRQCVTCFKAHPHSVEYLMGNLPSNRVELSSPFSNTGVDYAGPVIIKSKKTRGATFTKAYICLFVCFATKAIHLELVSDLTTECFMAALRRFISRRGTPKNIYSDNGTNFIGAHAEIQNLVKFFKTEMKEKQLQNLLISEGIVWHFIPPKTPHFGGLWEAGVKSAKTHLKRVIGNTPLTFEEYYTILTQVEAVLNSRPLSPLSSDPNDLNPLTPAHFLIGKSLTTIPDPDVTTISESRLSNYQHVQRMLQHYWRRWSKEYVAELQTRIKWQRDFSNLLKVGTLVIVKENNTPPMNWRLGRVQELHPGPDDVIRVVSVKFANTVLNRSVKHLCVLPIPANGN